MATEKLKFRLELYATMWDIPPMVKINVGEQMCYEGYIKGTEDKPDIVEFEREVEEGKKYDFVIHRSNKIKGQTVIDKNTKEILKDQILHIKSIEIDEINIGGLVYEGIYRPEYPEPWLSEQKKAGIVVKEEMKTCLGMGWNGTWTLSFESPFYMWLLENLY